MPGRIIPIWEICILFGKGSRADLKPGYQFEIDKPGCEPLRHGIGYI